MVCGCERRTRQMCLLWALPMRDLLPLLRKTPTLYHKAVQQALPKYYFDYLLINPIQVRPKLIACAVHMPFPHFNT